MNGSHRSDPAVSVLLPCRNADPWLEECLESLFAQRLLDFDHSRTWLMENQANGIGSPVSGMACIRYARKSTNFDSGSIVHIRIIRDIWP